MTIDKNFLFVYINNSNERVTLLFNNDAKSPSERH